MSNRVLLGIALTSCLAAGAVAVGRQQESRPAPHLTVDSPAGGRRALLPPTSEGSEATAETFLQQNQQLAARRLAELTERCDRLRAELEAAEAERSKWQAISEAMASVPERFGKLTAIPDPQPNGASSPFGPQPTGASSTVEPPLVVPPNSLPPPSPF